MPWYSYTPTTLLSNVCDPNNYTLVGVLPPACPSPKRRLCAVQAVDNMGRPILTPALLCEIASAMQNSLEGVNVRLRP